MKLTDLRGILQYIPQFREKTFIIGVDGVIVTDENFANILLDVAVVRSLNIRVVLVHGASAQIKSLADEQKIKASNLDGTGITDAETLQLALTAANRLTHEILEGLSANDLRAACTNAIIAHPMGIIQGADPGCARLSLHFDPTPGPGGGQQSAVNDVKTQPAFRCSQPVDLLN